MDIKKALKSVVDKFRKEQEVNTKAVDRAKRLQDAMKQEGDRLRFKR